MHIDKLRGLPGWLRRYRWPSILCALTSWVAGGFIQVLGIALSHLSCDDQCNARSGWRFDPGGWEWGAIELLALSALVCLSASALLVLLGRRRGADVALRGYLIAWAAWLTLASTGWIAVLFAGLFWAVPIVGLGVASVRLMPRRT